MTRQIKATHFSLLLHALFFWGALLLSEHTQAMWSPVALDFSILASSAPAAGSQQTAVAQIKQSPPPAVKRKVMPKPVAKKTPQTQAMPKKTVPAAEEKTPPMETVPVAASTDASSSQENASAAEAVLPAPAPGAGQGRGAGGIFSVGQLDGPLAVLTKPPPAYPPAAKRRNIEGWIRVKFLVDEHGQVGQISVLAAEPEGIFEQSVLRCVSHWRFKPGTVKGTAVKTLVEQTVTFKLEG